MHGHAQYWCLYCLGTISSFFILTGWLPNARLNNIVASLLKYLMPILIGYVGGFNAYGKLGGALGALQQWGWSLGHVLLC